MKVPLLDNDTCSIDPRTLKKQKSCKIVKHSGQHVSFRMPLLNTGNRLNTYKRLIETS